MTVTIFMLQKLLNAIRLNFLFIRILKKNYNITVLTVFVFSLASRRDYFQKHLFFLFRQL